MSLVGVDGEMRDPDGHLHGQAEEVELELDPEERASYKLIRAELHLMKRQKRRRRTLLERDSAHTPRQGGGRMGEAAAPVVASGAFPQPQGDKFSPQV